MGIFQTENITEVSKKGYRVRQMLHATPTGVSEAGAPGSLLSQRNAEVGVPCILGLFKQPCRACNSAFVSTVSSFSWSTERILFECLMAFRWFPSGGFQGRWLFDVS